MSDEGSVRVLANGDNQLVLQTREPQQEPA
jgi:hypothetical protein